MVARCVRGTDFDYGRLRVNLQRAPLRGFSADELLLRCVRSGDLIVEKSGGGDQQPVGRVVLFEGDEPAVPTNFAGRLRPGPGIDSRYMCYVMASLYFDGRTVAAVKRTTGIQNLDLDALMDNLVRIPPEEGQEKVAAFLDAASAHIDSLADLKRRLIALLKRRLSGATRSAALTQGWPIAPLRRLAQVIDCKHRTPQYVVDGLPVVSPGDVQPGRLDLARCHRFVGEDDFADLTEGPRRPMRGDIVYSRNASIGIAALVDTDDRFSMGQDVCLIRTADHDSRWLTLMLNTLGVEQLQEMKIGSTFDRVNIRQLLDLQIPAPPREVQEAEAARLDELGRQAAKVIAKLTQQLALLQERRQALITAAVTGQLDIPGVAA
ncbi:MAG: restriction endonuclease subunit S [Acidimicrobiia bacterium]|nr:restriction endonuclease subunit S [Acidimicrobiia bacterium]